MEKRFYTIGEKNSEKWGSFIAFNDKEILTIGSNFFGVAKSDVRILASRVASKLDLAQHTTAVAQYKLDMINTLIEAVVKTTEKFNRVVEVTSEGANFKRAKRRLLSLQEVTHECSNIFIRPDMKGLVEAKEKLLGVLYEGIHSIETGDWNRFNAAHTLFRQVSAQSMAILLSEREYFAKEYEDALNTINELDPALIERN